MFNSLLRKMLRPFRPGPTPLGTGIVYRKAEREGADVSMVPREGKGTRHRERLCIVVACADTAEAARLGSQISQVYTGTLVTYRKAEDILLNAPAGRVALIILVADDDPARLGKTLSWMRRRWHRCPVTVLGAEGNVELETAARMQGATYLTRPVGPEQWASLVQHVLSMHGRIATEVELG